MLYLLPVLLVILAARPALELLGVSSEQLSTVLLSLGVLIDILKGVGTVLVLLLLGLTYYRAHLAASAFGNGELGFWNAHHTSGAMIRATLTALPILGRLFQSPDP
jgi:hypothetical protein